MINLLQLAFCLYNNNLLSGDGAYKFVEKGSLKTDTDNIKALLRNELVDLSPDLHEKIATSIENNNIDRDKYRDLFVIKKRIINKGEKRIISFNIKEKLIPKVPEVVMLFSEDYKTRMTLIGILLLLAGLVITTSLNTYRSIRKPGYLK